MFYKENDSIRVKWVEGVHNGRGSIQIRSFFDKQSRLGTRLQVWELEPGTSEGIHIHQQDKPLEEIYYFLQGRGHMWIEEESIPVATGDAILIPSGVAHGFKNTGSEPLRLVLLFGKPVTERKKLEAAPGYLSPNHRGEIQL